MGFPGWSGHPSPCPEPGIKHTIRLFTAPSIKQGIVYRRLTMGWVETVRKEGCGKGCAEHKKVDAEIGMLWV